MKKTTLTVPSGTERVRAFAAEAKVSGRTVAELRVVEPGEPPAGDEPSDGAVVIDWNPLSFASARAAVIEAETALGGRLDELVIFADPPADAAGIAEQTPASIERAAMEWAAGYAELVREAAKRLGERGGGTIALIVAQAERGPIGSMAAGALLGLAEGLALSAPGAVRFVGARDESDQADLLARQAVKSLDEAPREPRRLLRLGGRGSLFGR